MKFLGLWRYAAGGQMWRHRGMELGSSGGALRACRCLPQELGSSAGALRACTCGGMGTRELGRRDAGV